MPLRYIEKILRASVYDVAIETPLDFAKTLSQRTQNQVFLKREDLQSVFSFKLRGAYNKMALLSSKQKKCGVIAASAGNHAQGVALAAQKLKINALIVMPTTTPEIKSQSVKAMGAEIILFGDSYSESCDYAYELAQKEERVFIHPYDDEDVIAGQGTVAMEILRQHTGKIDAIFVPVGGGGLIAGVAVYAKFVRPNIKIIGVEPEDSDCLNQALKAGKPFDLPIVGLFADGVAVKKIGIKPFELLSIVKPIKYVDEVITVSTDEICAAIKDIFDDTRSIAEPAGALATAGLKKYVEQKNVTKKTLIAIDSGANMNFDRLRYVAERAQVGEHREILFAVTIPEEAGSFFRFCEFLSQRNITEFNYRYFDSKEAQVFVGVSSSGHPDDYQVFKGMLVSSGFQVYDMTTNDLAKEHIRYMVGGHLPQDVTNERIFSVEFAERPGALLKFLKQFGARWNITLFHYRNHGSAFGKVLIGIQIPTGREKMFGEALNGLGYSFQEETSKDAYRLFLGGKTN